MLLDRSKDAKAHIAFTLRERHLADAVPKAGREDMACLEELIHPTSATLCRKELGERGSLFALIEPERFCAFVDLRAVTNVYFLGCIGHCASSF
jgi:hypothetical protein